VVSKSKFIRAQICFLKNIKGKKKIPNINSLYQMEPFDINIIQFGGLNQCQLCFSPSTAKIQRSLSLLSQPGIKNNKNKFLYQN
jgi:hypothetical protein